MTNIQLKTELRKWHPFLKKTNQTKNQTKLKQAKITYLAFLCINNLIIAKIRLWKARIRLPGSTGTSNGPFLHQVLWVPTN